MQKRLNKKGGMAISQILILIVGIVAFAFLIGVANVGFVSGNI
jgi:hypothetical protein